LVIKHDVIFMTLCVHAVYIYAHYCINKNVLETCCSFLSVLNELIRFTFHSSAYSAITVSESKRSVPYLNKNLYLFIHYIMDNSREVIELVNKLQGYFKSTGCSNEKIELPQIVVVGAQVRRNTNTTFEILNFEALKKFVFNFIYTEFRKKFCS